MLQAYWYQNLKYPNLGDDFTGLLLRRKYNLDPTCVDFSEAEIIATGSILGGPWAGMDKGRKKPLHVVGSGLMTPETRVNAKENLFIHSVRGYLTKEKLGAIDCESISVGDPGLLVASIVDPQECPKSTKVGVILHHTNAGNESLKRQFSHLPVTFLDIRTLDLDSFIANMRSCDVILSQSLHGLIFADALGIPNAWMILNTIHMGGHFKFYDYFSSVGRNFYQRVHGVPRTNKEIARATVVPNEARISSVTKDIDSSFLEAFKAIEKDRLPVTSFVDSGKDNSSEILLNVDRLGGKLRFDIDAELDKNISYRDVLITLDLIDRDGNRLRGARKIPGLAWSSSERVNHYRYLDVIPGASTYFEEVWLPEGVYCTGAKVIKWANPSRTARFKRLSVRSVNEPHV
ncbi:polysaccharide pyruvyl transferase family protein [Corynebacterium ammoniagenes]|uniref:polysaccharide pyruvyl transferase family protein n=1 Tax=Corynebacterium ammoniagenes TaxID=1697 RepID=UPI001459E262|nr:polysaccharide pyruvyl transferase family protein [Corynebacterium ammoniagenes]NMF31970.1 polysaccharide pyruvyl transferase family protein [Corynebacterium ammoniagenes]